MTPGAKKTLRIIVGLLLLPYALALVYRFVPAPSTLMLEDWLTGNHIERQWVPLKQMSPTLISAALISEDDAFCQHWGVDFHQMKRSVERAEASHSDIKSTSTITQQTVKNLFLWQERSFVRKGLEIMLAFWLELTWPKERILETYLNIAEFAPGVYGVQAAAEHHFGVSARALSSYQAVLLVTSLPNPIKRNASHPGPGQLLLAVELLHRLQSDSPDKSCLK